jgi:hypothetical protein
MPIETREVLAGNYITGLRNRRLLSHAVEVSPQGHIVRVLCARVPPASLSDRNASDPHALPTCERCQRKLAARAAAPEENPDA